MQTDLTLSMPTSLRDSALTRRLGRNGLFVALRCHFLLGGWPGRGWGSHPMGAVTMAGGLGGSIGRSHHAAQAPSEL